MQKQIERMHKIYGKRATGICGDCCNFIKGKYMSKSLQKCERYGLTHSLASDWAQKWVACGMFDVPLNENERPAMMAYNLRKIDNSTKLPLPGQITYDMFDTWMEVEKTDENQTSVFNLLDD